MGIGPIKGGLATLRSHTSGTKVAVAVGIGSTAVGGYAAGQRGNVPWQAVAYGGVIGLAATVPMYGVGRIASRWGTAARSVNKQLASEAITKAEHGARLLEIKAHNAAPARRLAAVTGGLAVGTAVTNIITPSIERSVSDAIIEQQSNGAPAEKKPEDGAAEQPAGG